MEKIADAIGYDKQLSSRREKVFEELLKLDMDEDDRYIVNAIIVQAKDRVDTFYGISADRKQRWVELVLWADIWLVRWLLGCFYAGLWAVLCRAVFLQVFEAVIMLYWGLVLGWFVGCFEVVEGLFFCRLRLFFGCVLSLFLSWLVEYFLARFRAVWRWFMGCFSAGIEGVLWAGFVADRWPVFLWIVGQLFTGLGTVFVVVSGLFAGGSWAVLCRF
ncbi:hypothetical protein RHMOL_Rhmol11G0187200 [Rhododendron molle]|uniref:Uncharacterized protein n=1 Tax=Rhododendron molle TaxID=49168 RepID=A0ACC0LVC1_RHOML|nr:hypothetical protein RHMOL_Rhmol11G0187200 [Rhododendron molle]